MHIPKLAAVTFIENNNNMAVIDFVLGIGTHKIGKLLDSGNHDFGFIVR